LEETAVWTRNVLILACWLVPSSVLAAVGNVPEGAEMIPTPAPSFSPQMSAPPACDMVCDASGTPPTRPWYYWWDTWHWFDRCHDRGQHYAYLPPLPGWYYFRPYSVGQLRAQQEAVMQWGGDPRNPYCSGVLPQQPNAQRAVSRSASPPRPAAGTNTRLAASATPPAGIGIIRWPAVLRDPRFATQRTRIEAPYHRNPKSEAHPTVADYQNMLESVGQMKVILGQMTAEISAPDGLGAGRFLDQLAAEARVQLQQARTELASASPNRVPTTLSTGELARRPE
jgi:hypothetical protein